MKEKISFPISAETPKIFGEWKITLSLSRKGCPIYYSQQLIHNFIFLKISYRNINFLYENGILKTLFYKFIFLKKIIVQINMNIFKSDFS